MRVNPIRVEAALIGGLLGAAACAVALLASTSGTWPLIVLATVPLLVRVAWLSMPLWLLLVTTAVPVIIAEVVQDEATSATWLIGCVALVTATIDRRRRAEWIPIAAVVGGPLWLHLTGAVGTADTVVAIWTMGLLLSATGGTIVGQQRRLIGTMRDAQANLAAAAAADERNRIARDLHDVVGHSFSVVLLHLAGARHLMSTDPDRAETALRQAEEVGRRSMDDLRASLALLRSSGDAHRPVGDLYALGGLVDGLREAGLDVRFSSAGDLAAVDSVVGMVIHSVAREALTNAAKHAGAGPVTCAIEVADRAVLRVSNPTRPDAGVSRGPAGHGLADMGERVRSVGGSLRIDDVGGEWTVVLDAPARGLQGAR